jgi:2-polyprenyl-3-methyl-5-hydroxy-6-metoxy-1,4-benzoquinol methylase
MTMPNLAPADDPARAALQLYREAPARVRAMIGFRWRSCPFATVAEAVPGVGRILDLGCGHGVFSCYLALSARRSVLGVDVDGDKIAIAEKAAELASNSGADIRFALSKTVSLPEGPWDGIVIVDVLYLLDPAVQRITLLECAGRLKPGGVLVVKETSRRPWWKYLLTVTQEALAVKVFGITEGGGLFFLPPSTLAAWMRDGGLEVGELPLHKGFVHPHHLLIGRRPARRTVRRPKPKSVAKPSGEAVRRPTRKKTA